MIQYPARERPESRLFRYLLLIALTVLVIAGMALFRTQSLPAAASPAGASVTATGYTAGVLDNHIVIYTNGQAEPSLVTEIDIRSLPLADQEALRRGISLPDDEALARLLEDYGS
ncbi:MAG: BofC C-terminal domain-containing protein [Intestinibacillus sp.]